MCLNLVGTIRSLSVILFGLLLLPAAGRAETVITNANYTLIVNNSNRVVQLVLSTNEFNTFAKVGYPSTADVRNLTTRIYTHFNDQFDFLILISDQDTVPSGKYFGLYFEAKNDIAGIGYRMFDSTAYYGSTGTLQGTIHLTSKNGLKGGPSLHEICHRWGGHLARPADGTSHWGLSSVGGQLGGWLYGSVTSLGGNLYQAKSPAGNLAFGATANYGNSVPYSELELYLMGLISTNEVINPIQIARNGVQTNPSLGQFTATGFDTLTISNIVATQGARVPNVAAAPKKFRAMVVVLTVAPLSTSRLAQYDADVRSFSLPGSDGSSAYNFWEATGGRAEMQMDGLVPKVAIVPSLGVLTQGSSIILSWPASAVGFVLESRTNLAPALPWSAVTPAPVVVNGQNVVTNPISTDANFYRLKK